MLDYAFYAVEILFPGGPFKRQFLEYINLKILDRQQLRVDSGEGRFKATCRCIGIKKWPYRRLTALKNLYNELKKDDLEHTGVFHTGHPE